jgi:hypothetical protein
MAQGLQIAALVAPLAFVAAACTSSEGSPAVANGSSSPPSSGVLVGLDDLCGTSVTPPRAATVRVRRDGRVVATAQVLAGDPKRGRFRFVLPAGKYAIAASNWPKAELQEEIVAGQRTTANFLSSCY